MRNIKNFDPFFSVSLILKLEKQRILSRVSFFFVFIIFGMQAIIWWNINSEWMYFFCIFNLFLLLIVVFILKPCFQFKLNFHAFSIYIFYFYIFHACVNSLKALNDNFHLLCTNWNSNTLVLYFLSLTIISMDSMILDNNIYNKRFNECSKFS